MNPRLLLACLLLTTVSAARATDTVPGLSADRIRERTAILSSDAFEGRGPGTPGEDKTVAYLIAEFKKHGLQPGNPDGTYVQDVPLVGLTSKTTVAFTTAGGETRELVPVNDYSALSRRVVPEIAVRDSEVVFVGHGVVAPEYGWDDYKGVDVRGKTVLMLINDPLGHSIADDRPPGSTTRSSAAAR
jgi:hypothetical protein